MVVGRFPWLDVDVIHVPMHNRLVMVRLAGKMS